MLYLGQRVIHLSLYRVRVRVRVRVILNVYGIIQFVPKTDFLLRMNRKLRKWSGILVYVIDFL